ncbi:helix-turn-helix domain-containing protein [Euzebya tangerina]|uniref:helix-turn-helix domain-containing protein n=1 Tax=Euzebya tangerina TaxID=591198 RepID=UPI000E3240D6|nr:helix-turn-helix domain-containing protein [Euzebya tangerina]
MAIVVPPLKDELHWLTSADPVSPDVGQLADEIVRRLNKHIASTRLLTLPEVADMLRCSQKSVRRMVRDGRLSAFKVAERILFKPDEVGALVSRSRVTYIN